MTEKYIPPKSAQASAKKVLAWREKYGDEVKGMTQVGWTRANQLASGEPISLDIVKRMAQFNRHRKNSTINPKYKDTPWKDRGYVAWLGWGNTEAIDWAIKISQSISKEADMEKEQNYIYGTVYKTNIYTCKATGSYFTQCEQCKAYQYIDSESDGYCEECEAPLGDAHNDFIDSDYIEQMRLSYMQSINDKINKLDELVLSLLKGNDINLLDYIKSSVHHVGIRHNNFSKENGFVVDTHIVKEKFETFGNEYESVEWKAGFVVSNEIFQKVKSNEYNGFSFGGMGLRENINTISDDNEDDEEEDDE